MGNIGRSSTRQSKKCYQRNCRRRTAYSTGTVVHADVTATTNTDTAQTVEAKTAGDAGNEIEVSTTGSDLSWGDDNLLGGYDDDGNTVVIGNDAEASQVNLRHAINGTGTWNALQPEWRRTR